jgi:hypothetical protein
MIENSAQADVMATTTTTTTTTTTKTITTARLSMKSSDT